MGSSSAHGPTINQPSSCSTTYTFDIQVRSCRVELLRSTSLRCITCSVHRLYQAQQLRLALGLRALSTNIEVDSRSSFPERKAHFTPSTMTPMLFAVHWYAAEHHLEDHEAWHANEELVETRTAPRLLSYLHGASVVPVEPGALHFHHLTIPMPQRLLSVHMSPLSCAFPFLLARLLWQPLGPDVP